MQTLHSYRNNHSFLFSPPHHSTFNMVNLVPTRHEIAIDRQTPSPAVTDSHNERILRQLSLRLGRDELRHREVELIYIGSQQAVHHSLERVGWAAFLLKDLSRFIQPFYCHFFELVPPEGQYVPK